MKRIGVVAILAFAFFGLADSIYLTQHELSGTPLICNIQNLSGCNVVVSSPYSYLFGIPIAELGVLFYSVLFVLAALELVIFDQLLRRALQVLALIGVLSSLYFTSVQIFFIGALCVYCLASSITTLFILIFASLIEPVRKRTSKIPAPPPLIMPPAA